MAGKKIIARLASVAGLAFLLNTPQSAIAAGGAFTVSSPQIQESGLIAKEQVFAGFGCHGMNISPELKWRNIPVGTKSITVTVYDPDAPTGSGWWHWLVVNLPPDTKGLSKGAGAADSKTLPKGAIQTRTDFGAPGYGGPCPPKGDHAHRYMFTVHALDIDKLDVDTNASPALVGFYLNYHTLAKASLMGLYRR